MSAAKKRKTDSKGGGSVTAGPPPQHQQEDEEMLGISLVGLRKLAASAKGRSMQELWIEQWGVETLPPGWSWTVKWGDSVPSSTWQYVYRNEATGEERVKTPENEFRGEGSFKPPAGTISVLQYHGRELLVGELGVPTHNVSYPWRMPFSDIVEAVGLAVEESEDARIFMDGLALDYHIPYSINPNDKFPLGLEHFCEGRPLIQVCSRWDDPERLKRLFMMAECAAIVAYGGGVIVGLTRSERSRMANALRAASGPDEILSVVYKMEMDPAKGLSSMAKGGSASVTSFIERCWAKAGGQEKMSAQLRESTRKAYASAVDGEFARRYASRSEADALAICDLGHQLGCLWALANDRTKAEDRFRKVIGMLQETDASEASKNAIARMDRTSAELVKLLRQSERTSDAYTAEREVSRTGELPVSWEGVSVSFLQRFYDEHRSDIEFLSTDAVVERIIKPKSQTNMYDPDPTGRAMVEMAHSSYRGRPSFFISHAWRQTFSVLRPDRDWRGGFVQAMVERVPVDQRATTFFWMDIFSVNQHLKSPYGGLLAFAFDPLRNAMIDCDKLLLFLEVFDDPAPLGRVWCLDELRIALLLGKEVEIIMPPQAMRSLKRRVSQEDGKSSVMDDIDRVVTRIDVTHASASFASDREYVLKQVESTIGVSALNRFCKEIIRRALVKVAGLDGDEGRREEHWAEMDEIFKNMLDMVADVKVEILRKIEVKRAVALMKWRIYAEGSAGRAEATELLKGAAEDATRFYGPSCQIVQDITNLLA